MKTTNNSLERSNKNPSNISDVTNVDKTLKFRNSQKLSMTEVTDRSIPSVESGSHILAEFYQHMDKSGQINLDML